MQVFSTKMQEANLFLDLNNDIDRLVKVLDSVPEIRKLLYYIEKDALSKEKVKLSLIDRTIYRLPLVPLTNDTEKDASYIVITLLISDNTDEGNSAITNIAIDILTPPDQWIINEGLRPLILGKYVNDAIRYQFNQTAGVKYRMDRIINIKLSDRLVGYRLVYESIHEE